MHLLNVILNSSRWLPSQPLFKGWRHCWEMWEMDLGVWQGAQGKSTWPRERARHRRFRNMNMDTEEKSWRAWGKPAVWHDYSIQCSVLPDGFEEHLGDKILHLWLITLGCIERDELVRGRSPWLLGGREGDWMAGDAINQERTTGTEWRENGGFVWSCGI